MVNNVDLFLEHLEASVCLETKGLIYKDNIDDHTYDDVIADIDVSLNAIKDLFQIGVDGIENGDSKPTRYYVVEGKIPSLDIGTKSYMTKGEINNVDINGIEYHIDYQSIKYDFVRHLANSLFNTFRGIDLFINKDNLIENVNIKVNGVYNTNICDLIKTVSTNSENSLLSGDNHDKYFTDENNGKDNLCRELYLQLMRKTPYRFKNLKDISERQPLPFLDGDSIGFIIIVKPADGQEDIMKKDNAINDLVIEPRKYLVRLRLKDDGTPPVVPSVVINPYFTVSSRILTDEDAAVLAGTEMFGNLEAYGQSHICCRTGGVNNEGSISLLIEDRTSSKYGSLVFTGAETYVNILGATETILKKPTGIHTYKNEDDVRKIIICNSRGGARDTGSILLVDYDTKTVDRILCRGDESIGGVYPESIQSCKPATEFGVDFYWILDANLGLMLCQCSAEVIPSYEPFYAIPRCILFPSGTTKPSAFHFQDGNLLILYSEGGVRSRGEIQSYKWLNTWADIVFDFQSHVFIDGNTYDKSLLMEIITGKVVMDGSEMYDEVDYCLDKPTYMAIDRFDVSGTNNMIRTGIANAKDGVGNVKFFGKTMA